MGTFALLTTVFYTFLPCFLYIFAGGPLIEKSHGSQTISSVLKLVSAAVVGVILNLTIYLGKDVIFPGGVAIAHLDLISLTWILVSLFLLVRLNLNVICLIFFSLCVGFLRFIAGI
jgi:chromate transporter